MWGQIHEGPSFRAWRRAPGYPGREPSFTAHADAVEVFVSPEVAKTLDGPEPPTAWPEGSTIVKEGFKGTSRALVAVMQKRNGEWYWAEFDDAGEPLFSGRPQICLDCHDNRAAYSDWVYSFEFPR